MQRSSAGLSRKRTLGYWSFNYADVTDSCVFLHFKFYCLKSPVSARIGGLLLCLPFISMGIAFCVSVGGQTCDEHLQWLMMMDKDVDYRQGWLHALTGILSVPLFFHQCFPLFFLPPVCQISMIIILPFLSVPVVYTRQGLDLTVNSMLFWGHVSEKT